jgi:hypothetical protein
MEDHGVRASIWWALRFQFAERPFQNFVGENGHWTALSFGLEIERRDQMPLDGG